MSQEIKGFVKKLNVKEGTGKRGAWKAYSGRIELDDGTEFDGWVSFGFEAPPFKEGDYVKFSAEKDDKGYLKMLKGSGKVSKNPPARATTQNAAGVETPVGDFNRQTNPEDARRMGYANARTAAIEVIKLLVEVDGLPLTKAVTKAAEAKRFDEVLAAVDKLTVRFYNDGVSLRQLTVVADTFVASDAADGELPGEDDSASAADAEEVDDPEFE
jgi:hypothetical protein